MDIVDYVKQKPLREFSRGEVLLSKDDAITSLFAIRTGYVKVTSISASGVERLIWIAGRYDITPTEQFFSKYGSTQFFYTALTDGSYYELDKTEFINNAKEDQALMTEIARSMSSHYDDFMTRLDAVDAATVTERLLRTLSYLGQRLSADSNVNLHDYNLKLTHRDLAAMISSTRETTSLILAEFRTQGLITYNRSSFIIHTDKILAKLETI